VTRDNDLLFLATGHSIDAKQFRQRFPTLKILNPVDFIAAISQARTGTPPAGQGS
jgi:hypothetical protein